jgi:hypothetical protein
MASISLSTASVDLSGTIVAVFGGEDPGDDLGDEFVSDFLRIFLTNSWTCCFTVKFGLEALDCNKLVIAANIMS